MKILFTGFRDHRHSKFGGYDWIRFYPNSDYFSDENVLLGNIPIGQRGKVMNLKILDFFTRHKAKKYDLVHYFYGDLTIFKPLPKKRKYKAIATIHCNTDKLEPHHENIIECLKTFDAVVVLNSQQQRYLSEKYNINSYFIPHGFNKPIFENVEISSFIQNFDKTKINVITIGKQYRDYETLEKIIIEQKNPNVHFYLVGLKKELKEKFTEFDNVTVCGFLDDNQYYSLITACDWSFLPLTYATANNALMESHYLGIPCILPKISGVTDYACKEENFFYEDTDTLLEFFTKISKREKSQVLMNYAGVFSWNNIYNKLSSMYKEICYEKEIGEYK